MSCPYLDKNYPVNMIWHDHENVWFCVMKMLCDCLPIPAHYLAKIA